MSQLHVYTNKDSNVQQAHDFFIDLMPTVIVGTFDIMARTLIPAIKKNLLTYMK